MATSNNDRISSRRLLDTLKGLQTSRHLGSEPEVVTETVEYPAEVFPKSGTYTGNDVIAQLGTASFDLEHNLPIKVYGSITSDTDGFVVPDKSGEPLATLNVVSKPSGLTVISDVEVTDEMISNQPITGHYFLMQQGNYWLCFYEIADVTNFNTAHVWETTGYTETTTNKTKHTIKQDYVPNADWNVNDPDADGYVQGRTHWVEVGETEATVNVQTGVAIGNFATGTCDKFGAVKGFTYPTGEYNPGRTGEIGKIEEYGQTIAFSYIGEDENGNAIVPTNLDELQNALSSTAIGIMLIEEQGASVIVYVVYPNVTSNDVCTATIASETVHKLDRKFYDYTEPFDSSKTLTTDNSFDYSNINRESLNRYLGKNIGFKNSSLRQLTINATQGENCWKITGFSGSGVDANYKPIQTVANKMNCMLEGKYSPQDLLNTISTAWRIGYSTTNSGQKYYYLSKEKREFIEAPVVFENNNDAIMIDVVNENEMRVGFGITGDNLEPLSEVVNNRITLEFYYNTPSVFRENAIELPIKDNSVTESALANKAVTQNKLNYAIYEWYDTPDEYDTCFSNKYLHNKRVPLIVKPVENNILMPTIVEAPLYSWKFANDNQDVSFDKLCGYIKLAKAGMVGTSGTKNDRTYQIVDINATFERNMFKDNFSSSTRLYFVDQDDTDGNYINGVQLEYNATYGFGFNIPVIAELMTNDGTWWDNAITVLKGALVGSIESSGYLHFEYISLYDPETGSAWTNNDIGFDRMRIKLAFHA